MAATLTRQPRILGASGATLFGEGEGAHTRIYRDGFDDLNNLGTYVDPRVVFCAGNGGNYNLAPVGKMGQLNVDISGASSAMTFLAQVPILIPRGVRRLCFTLGYTLTAAATFTSSVSAIFIILSKKEYLSGGITAGLPLDYASRSNTVTNSVTGGTSAYALLDDSTTGLVYPPAWSIFPTPYDTGAWLILGATVTNDDAPNNQGNTFNALDFTAWSVWE